MVFITYGAKVSELPVIEGICIESSWFSDVFNTFKILEKKTVINLGLAWVSEWHHFGLYLNDVEIMKQFCRNKH